MGAGAAVEDDKIEEEVILVTLLNVLLMFANELLETIIDVDDGLAEELLVLIDDVDASIGVELLLEEFVAGADDCRATVEDALDEEEVDPKVDEDINVVLDVLVTAEVVGAKLVGLRVTEVVKTKGLANVEDVKANVLANVEDDVVGSKLEEDALVLEDDTASTVTDEEVDVVVVGHQ